MGNYRELVVWQQSVTLAVDTYQVCERLPSNEQYGLRGQMQRAAVSVAANIAEGCGPGSDASFLNFVRIAIGSLNELDTLWVICKRVHPIEDSVDIPLEHSIRDLAIRSRNLASTLQQAISNASPQVREEIEEYDATM